MRRQGHCLCWTKFFSGKFCGLVVVTNDPTYRSNLSSFTLEHVTVQTTTMFHYYRELTLRLGEDLEYINGPWGTVLSCNPKQHAVEKAMELGRVCKKTVYNWKNDFLQNGFRFSESLVGKSIHA